MTDFPDGAHHEFDMSFNVIFGEIAHGHLMRQSEDCLGQMIYQDRLILGRVSSAGRKFR